MAAVGPGEPQRLGRAPSGKSYRLNPELALADTAVDVATVNVEPQPDEVKKDLAGMLEALSAGQAGGRRQRGGDGGLFEFLQKLVSAPDEAEEDMEAALAIVKAYATVAVHKTKEVAEKGAEAAGINKETVKQFLIDEYGAPLKKLGYDAGKIFFQLVYQVGVRLPVSGLLFSVSAAGAVANVTAKIITFANDKLRSGGEYLISEEYAMKVATAAVATTKDSLSTAGVGVFVLNQVGFLPASAVIAAILFTLQLNLGSGGGRAYLAASLYSWYQSQDSAGKIAFQSAAKEYAKQAKSAAKKSPEEVKKAATAAAGALASALAKAGKTGENAGKSAFQAVGEAAKKAGDWVDKQSKLPVDAAKSITDGAPAAAAAVVAAEASPEGRSVAQVDVPMAPGAMVGPGDEGDGAAGPPRRRRAPGAPVAPVSRSKRRADEAEPDGAAAAAAMGDADGAAADADHGSLPTSASKKRGVGGRKKKTRRAPKRRITRRARKYLAAPVFSY